MKKCTVCEDSAFKHSGVEKWLSRQPHKLKTVGSSPTSATIIFRFYFFYFLICLLMMWG